MKWRLSWTEWPFQIQVHCAIFMLTYFTYEVLPFLSFCAYKNLFFNVNRVIPAVLKAVFDILTWDLNSSVPLFQESLIIDDMWWSKPNKINDPCCCNEKVFFCGHAFILLWWRHGWIGWAFHISKGREINIMPDFSSTMSPQVWLPAEKQLFHSWVLTARHVLFQIKPSRSQSHLFLSKRRQNGILQNNNKFTVDVRNHNKFSMS